MMYRFNTKWGAALLIGLGCLYLILSLATGRSAAAERPVDLSASDPGLDVWKTAALLVRETGRVAIVDVRSKEHYDQYHLPGSVHASGTARQGVWDATQGKKQVVLVFDDDKEGLAWLEKGIPSDLQVHYLKDGVRSWYLALELPVALFSDKAAPHGYDAAIGAVRSWFGKKGEGKPEEVLDAIGVLALNPFEPTRLQGSKPRPSAGSVKKKITGGCGG